MSSVVAYPERPLSYSPAPSWLVLPFKHSNLIKGLFLYESIDRDDPRRPSANNRDTFNHG